MYIIRSNYSNNSAALIQWALENKLEDVTVLYVDTGWAAEGWLDYVSECESAVQAMGFKVAHLDADTPFEDIMEIKGGFPTRERQWCSLHLKGIPFLKWVDDIDPDGTATVVTAKTSIDTHFTDIPEFIESCEYHGERRVWHPLYAHSREERDALIERSPFETLKHESYECSPCINATVADLRDLNESDIEKLEELEEELENTLFDPKECGNAVGIRAVVAWAKQCDDDALNFKFGCSASFGCGV